ncbi:MAG: acyltransferase [archaeon]|nr:acyltransferase [archaeon]
MQKFNSFLVSKNRGFIYGFAILMIMFFHSTFSIPNEIAFKPIILLKNFCNIGVDLFLVVSGISLYFSFEKDSNILHFYLKRVLRVVIPTLLVTIPWFLYHDVINNRNVSKFFLDFLGISLFVDGDRSIWFITLILFCYIIYPFVNKLFKKFKWNLIVPIILILLNICLNLLLSNFASNFFNNTEIFFRHIPIFIVGSYLGKFVFEKREVKCNKVILITLSILLIAAYLAIEGILGSVFGIFQRYIISFLSLFLLILLSLLGQIKIFNKILSPLSLFTLEIYLFHERFIIIFNKFVSNINVINVLAILAAILIAFLFRKCFVFIQNRIEQKTEKGETN